MENLRRLTLIAGAALLIPAAAAQGATKDMFAGTPPKGLLKGVPEFATDNAFYAKRVTIHKGDSVSFKIVGFHNVYLPKKGDPIPGLFTVDPSNPVAGVKDAAGGGLLVQQPAELRDQPAGGRADGGKTYDGSEAVGSGLPLAGPPEPLKVKFPKKGRYTVLCLATRA